jgi:pseudouridine synthase
LEDEHISVDGVRVRVPLRRMVIVLHKPTGYVTSRTDPAGRPTVYTLLADLGQWVLPVGRLDRDSSGLLILTNDHRLGHALTDPEHHVPKTYHVRVTGVVADESLVLLRGGIPLPNGATTRPAHAQLLGANRDGTSWIEITLTEGRNRQVRKMCAAVGHDVVQLVRVRIASLGLGDLPRGAWRRLRPDEIARLAGGRGRHLRAVES